MPGPRLPIEASDVSRPADFTAAPQNHALAVLSPIRPLQGVVVARQPGSIDRAGLSRRALELGRRRDQAVEPTHRAAVILLGNARERLGDTVGGRRQETFVVQL